MIVNASLISRLLKVFRRERTIVFLALSICSIIFLLWRMHADQRGKQHQIEANVLINIQESNISQMYHKIAEPTASNWIQEVVKIDTLGFDSEDICYPDIVNSWRSNVKDVCVPITSIDTNHVLGRQASSLKCHEYSVNGIIQPLCIGENLVLDFSKVDIGPDTNQYSNPKSLKVEKGAILALNCIRNENYEFKKEWLTDAFDVMVPRVEASDSNICDHDFGDDVLYLHQRWDCTNPFHIHEDLIMTYIGYSVLSIDRSHTQVVFLDDRRPDGPAVPIWTKAFSNRDAIGLYDLKQKFAEKDIKKVCVKKLVVGVTGGKTPYSNTVGGVTHCSHHLFQAFSYYMLDALQLKLPTSWSNPQSNKLKILVVSRRDYLGRSIRRKIINDRQFAEYLQNELIESATVDLVDFSELPMIDQIQKWMKYDICIAAHGAAQVYATYSPHWFSMIEIQHPERWYNWHYSNLAKLLGFWYTEIRLKSQSAKLSEMEVREITALVKGAVEHTMEKKFGSTSVRAKMIDLQLEHCRLGSGLSNIISLFYKIPSILLLIFCVSFRL